MRNLFKGSTLAIAAAAVIAIFSLLSAQSTAGQSATYRAPRLDGHPDLNGIWQAVNSANWDIQAHPAGPAPYPMLLGAFAAEPAGQGVVEGNEIPYQPWALAKKKENYEHRLTVDPLELIGGDPEARCYLPGVPRATYLPYPFQIVQAGSTDAIGILYEFDTANRVVHMGNEDVPKVEAWMGLSHGKWDGETLVVDVTDLNEATWFDRAGNFHSDALHVVERYTPLGPDALNYEATIEDPKVFTRPWKMSMPLYRRLEKNIRLLSFKCVEFAEPYAYGKISNNPEEAMKKMWPTWSPP
jgi:hypothetical protein